MKLVELVIDESKDSGVDYIALVDEPAIESNWQAFGKVKQRFQIENEEKRIISGYLMKADLPILRIDENGEEYHVVFRKDTVIEIEHKFMRNGFNSNANIMHDKNRLAEGVYLFESILIDKERGQLAPPSFESAPDGSWWGSMQVENDELWEQIKNGEFKGFSVEGLFLQMKPKKTDEQTIEDIKTLIQNFLAEK